MSITRCTSRKKAEAILILVSGKTNERPWINYEAGVAEGVAKQRDERGFATNILPVILDSLPKAAVSWPLQRYQSCDAQAWG